MYNVSNVILLYRISLYELYNKRDNFNFRIVNFPFICNNITGTVAYWVDAIFQSLWSLSRFPFYGGHHTCSADTTICVKIERRHVAFVVITILSYPIAWPTIVLFIFSKYMSSRFNTNDVQYVSFLLRFIFFYVICIFNIYWCPTLFPNQMMCVSLIVTRLVRLVEQEVLIRPEQLMLVGFGLFNLWLLV
jgi:hypothetical protein